MIAADLGRAEDVERIMGATADLDVGLFVGAAGFGGSGDLVDANLEHELSMIDVNCRALLRMTYGYAQRLADRGRGGIILLSSVVAFQGVPRAANYAATKAYVQSLAEGLGHELGPRGVHVLASAPGPVESGFGARADMKLDGGLSPAIVARDTLDALGRSRIARPGLRTKFLLGSLTLLPRWLRVRIVGLVMYGMTKHQLAAGRA